MSSASLHSLPLLPHTVATYSLRQRKLKLHLRLPCVKLQGMNLDPNSLSFPSVVGGPLTHVEQRLGIPWSEYRSESGRSLRTDQYSRQSRKNTTHERLAQRVRPAKASAKAPTSFKSPRAFASRNCLVVAPPSHCGGGPKSKRSMDSQLVPPLDSSRARWFFSGSFSALRAREPALKCMSAALPPVLGPFMVGPLIPPV